VTHSPLKFKIFLLKLKLLIELFGFAKEILCDPEVKEREGKGRERKKGRKGKSSVDEKREKINGNSREKAKSVKDEKPSMEF
jgi:hypothetical protein